LPFLSDLNPRKFLISVAQRMKSKIASFFKKEKIKEEAKQLFKQ
jgi:hypothetical protein